MKKQVLAYLHTHYDREWYRTKEEFNLRLLEIFDEVIDELLNNNAPCFYFDGQTDALKNYLKFRNEKLDVVKKLIAEKRLYIGPFTTLADSFLVSGKFLEKNLEYGIKYAKSLGVTDFLGYLPDTFGHSRGIFEILKKFDIKNAILWRGIPNIDANFVANGVNCVRLVNGYAVDLFHNGAKASEIEAFLDKIAKYSDDKILLPIGSDHLKILKNANEKIAKINSQLKNYEIKLTSPFEYFENFKATKKIDGEFLSNDNSFLLQGVYSARIDQKIINARLQHELSNVVEPFSKLTGAKYQAPIDYAYELLIKNHAHDSIYGCSIDEVHTACNARYLKADEVIKGVKNRIIRDYKAENPDNEGKIQAINLSDSDFEGIIKVECNSPIENSQVIKKYQGFDFDLLYDTGKIPVTEDFMTLYTCLIKTPTLKANECKVFEPVASSKSIKCSDNSIKNDKISLEVVDGKINIKSSSGECLEDCFKITYTKDLGDSYNFSPFSKPMDVQFLGTKIVEKGDLRSILRIYYHNIELNAILYENADFIVFEAHINNRINYSKYQAQFNLNKPIFETIADDCAGQIKRVHDPDYSLFDNLPAVRPMEVKTNFFPMQKWVFAQNVILATEGLNEYEIEKNAIKIALLRGFGTISNPNNPARSIPAGPPLETKISQCLGRYKVHFAFSFAKSPKDKDNVLNAIYPATIGWQI